VSFIEVSFRIPGLIEYPEITACVGAKIGLEPTIKAGFLRKDEREGLRIALVRDRCGFNAGIRRISPDVLNKIDEGWFQREVLSRRSNNI
jgi:hypothetical protein